MLTSDQPVEPTARSNTLPISSFSTAALPINERFATWRECISGLFDTQLDSSDDSDRFHAAVTGCLLGPISQMRCTASRQRYRRTAAKIAQDGIDHYMIQIYRGGAGRAVAHGGDIVFPTGAISVFDNAQPLDSADEDSDILSLFIPRSLLAPRLQSADDQHLRCISPDSPLVFLLRNHMEGLFAAAPRMTVDEGAFTVEPTVALVASLLNGAPHRTGRGCEAVDLVLLGAIKRHIDTQIVEPTLSPESLAATFGITRSRLYRLFEPTGGVADYIRSRRLKAAFVILSDPRQCKCRLIDIALDLGFNSENSFARAFRRQYGISPGEARAACGAILGRVPAVTGAFGDRHWENWIRRI